MVAGAFPFIKLVTLGIKQLAKPIANGIIIGAKQSDLFRRQVVWFSRKVYRLETFVKMRFMGLQGPVNVKPLNEEKAVELGAEMFGQAIIYGIGAGTIFFEINRSQKKDQQKEEIQNYEIQALKDKIDNLGLDVEQQAAQIRELTQLINSMHGVSNKKFSNS